MTDFLILDVFTDAPFGGNQLAVIPDATGVAEDRLQKIAREFNFSESTFVYPPDDPAHTARVRIFTPLNEIPFAGHPTIGTAVALARLGRGPEMVLELGVGPIAATADGTTARFTTEVPLTRGARPTPEHAAACLDLAADDIETGHHPPEVAGVGLDFALVELANDDALRRASPVVTAFRTAAAVYPGKLDFAILAYRRDGSRIRARMFAPLDGVPEDPATGSAAAALSAYLAELDGRPSSLRIEQGIEMGRPSLIRTEVSMTGGKVRAVTVAGSAVVVARGQLTLD